MDEKQLNVLLSLLEKVKKQAKQLGLESPFSEEQIRDAKSYEDTLKSLSDQFRSFSDILNSINDDLGGIVSSINRTLEDIGSKNEGVNRVFRNLRSIRDVAQKIASEQSGEIQLSSKELEKYTRSFSESFGILKNEFESGGITQRISEQEKVLEGIQNKETQRYKEQAKKLQELIDLQGFLNQETGKQAEFEQTLLKTIKERLDQRKKEEEQIREAEGFTGVALESSQEVLKKVGLGSLSKFIDLEGIRGKVREESEKLVGKGYLRKFIGQTGIAFKTMGRVGVGAFKALLNPATLVIGLIKGIGTAISTAIQLTKQLDKESADLAKNFNLTYQEAVALRGELAQAAIATNDIFVNSQALLETLSIINRITGTRQFSLGDNLKESVIFLTQIEQRAQLGADAIGRISQLTFFTNESAEDLTKSLLGTVEVLNATDGILINEKNIFKEISELSEATLLSLSRTPIEIAKAFRESKLLGATLSQVDRISDGLVDFQTSIRKEIEATVITGRDLNLNAARFFALNNDTAGVAREIRNQIGSAAEFAEMNRIAQNSIAEALGFSRDEFAKILFIQEQLGDLRGEERDERQRILNKIYEEKGLQAAIAEAQEGSLKRLVSQVGITDRFQAAISRLKDAFIPALVPLTSAINTITAFVTDTLPSFISGVGEFFTSLGTGILNKIQDIKEAFSILFTDLSSFFKPLTDFMGDTEAIPKLLRGNTNFSETPSESEVSTEIQPQRGYSSSLTPRIPATGRTIPISSTVPIEGSTMNVTNSQKSIQNINNISNVESNIINSNEKVIAAIEDLKKSNKEDATLIAKTKTRLQVGATDFGTQLGVNSYSIQYG